MKLKLAAILFLLIAAFPAAYARQQSADVGDSYLEMTQDDSKEDAWIPDGIISEGEYSKEQVIRDGLYKVYWKNDAEDLYMALDGESTGFVAIGFEPSVRMKDADMVMGWVEEGNATVMDLYATGPTGPHPMDEDLGGTDDILEFGGMEMDGRTIIEFHRKMDTGDEWDKALVPEQTVQFIWSISRSDAFGTKHFTRGMSQLSFE